LQVSRAADPETLQSQLAKTARKRLSLSGLELLHGRLKMVRLAEHIEWAEKHNALPEVAAFLRGLQEDEWHHLSE
jgi:hypothetical protein